MKNRQSAGDSLPSQLKCLIVGTLRLRTVKAEDIDDDEPLIGGSLGLDSLDELELAMRVEEDFGITIHTWNESRAVFASIASLAAFIRAQNRARAAAGPNACAEEILGLAATG